MCKCVCVRDTVDFQMRMLGFVFLLRPNYSLLDRGRRHNASVVVVVLAAASGATPLTFTFRLSRLSYYSGRVIYKCGGTPAIRLLSGSHLTSLLLQCDGVWESESERESEGGGALVVWCGVGWYGRLRRGEEGGGRRVGVESGKAVHTLDG